jgi:hypothetical protein
MFFADEKLRGGSRSPTGALRRKRFSALIVHVVGRVVASRLLSGQIIATPNSEATRRESPWSITFRWVQVDPEIQGSDALPRGGIVTEPWLHSGFPRYSRTGEPILRRQSVASGRRREHEIFRYSPLRGAIAVFANIS